MREESFPTQRDASSQDNLRKVAPRPRYEHDVASARTDRERGAAEDDDGAYNLPFTD